MNFILNIPPSPVTHQSGTRRLKTGRSYKKPELKTLEKTYMTLLSQHKPRYALKGPVFVSLTFNFPWLKKHKDRSPLCTWTWKDTEPDVANMEKTLIDCMTKTGFWKNDGQIALLHLAKTWADHPNIEITVRQL